MGRPSSYSDELGKRICKEIATSTDSISQICSRNPDFPTRKCVYEWRIDHPSFGDAYAHAKRIQADLLAEEIVSIAYDGSQDLIIDEDGKERCNNEFVQRSRLKVDTLKWLAAKLLPRMYGDKQHVESNITVTHEQSLKELE